MKTIKFLMLPASLMLFVSLAHADNFPSASFSQSNNKSWRMIHENEDASVLFKDNSRSKETIVLRVFEQSASAEDRTLAFKGDLSKINQARNKVLELSGGGRQEILEIVPFERIANKKISGVFIESVFESANQVKSQVFERQYYTGNKVYQVLYVTKGTGTKAESAKSVLDSYLPKSSRNPASELMSSQGARTSKVGANSYKDVDLSIPTMNIPKTVSSKECASVPVEKRRSESTSIGEVSATVLASTGGCMVGVWDSIKTTIVGLKDMAVGIYNYASDSVQREQVNAALGILWAEFSNDPKQFTHRVATNVYNLAAQSGGDFLCMNAVAQAETVCKMLPYLVSGGFLVKVATRAKLTAAEAKAIEDAAATAKKSVLTEAKVVAKVSEIEGPPAGMQLDPRGFMPGGNQAFSSRMGDMNLITPSQLKELPDGTVLYSINGKKAVVGVDYVDGDTRGGFLAYGFLKKDVKTEAKVVAKVPEIEGPPAGMQLDSRGFMPGGNQAFSSRMGDMNLITPSQLKELPKGTVLYSIDGKKAVVGVDYVDGDTRGGFLAYGFLKKDVKDAGSSTDAALGSTRAPARLTANSKPIDWEKADEVITRASREMTSSSPESVRAALQEIKNINIDSSSYKQASAKTYNEKLIGIVTSLTKYVRSPDTPPELKKEATQAMLQFSRVNSGNYKMGILGRIAPDSLADIYYDPRIPDDVRKLVHLELSVVFKSSGFGAFPNFRSSVSMMDEFKATGRVQGVRP